MQAEDSRLPVDLGRSGCPINMTMEVLGDRWSLIVIRDLMFGHHRHFRELLIASQEGIASNILSDRLAKLTAAGLLSRHPDPTHRQKVIYSLTEASIQLAPVLAQIGGWGARWMPTTTELRVRADVLAHGGPPLWEALMEELRAEHLRGEPCDPEGVRARLDAAYEERIRDTPSGTTASDRDNDARTRTTVSPSRR